MHGPARCGGDAAGSGDSGNHAVQIKPVRGAVQQCAHFGNVKHRSCEKHLQYFLDLSDPVEKLWNETQQRYINPIT